MRADLVIFKCYHQYFLFIYFQLYFFEKYHLNTLLFVYNFPGFPEKAKKQVFSSNRPLHFDWLEVIHAPDQPLRLEGVGITQKCCRIVADDGQNVTVETSNSRALCYVNGHQIKADNEPQQLCDGDGLVLGNCTHVFCFHAPGGATGSNSSGGGRGVGSFAGAVRAVILQRPETRDKS